RTDAKEGPYRQDLRAVLWRPGGPMAGDRCCRRHPALGLSEKYRPAGVETQSRTQVHSQYCCAWAFRGRGPTPAAAGGWSCRWIADPVQGRGPQVSLLYLLSLEKNHVGRRLLARFP